MNAETWQTIHEALTTARYVAATESFVYDEASDTSAQGDATQVARIDAALAAVERMQLLSSQWPARVSQNTLGAPPVTCGLGIAARGGGDGEDEIR